MLFIHHGLMPLPSLGHMVSDTVQYPMLNRPYGPKPLGGGIAFPVSLILLGRRLEGFARVEGIACGFGRGDSSVVRCSCASRGCDAVQSSP